MCSRNQTAGDFSLCIDPPRIEIGPNDQTVLWPFSVAHILNSCSQIFYHLYSVGKPNQNNKTKPKIDKRILNCSRVLFFFYFKVLPFKVFSFFFFPSDRNHLSQVVRRKRTRHRRPDRDPVGLVAGERAARWKSRRLQRHYVIIKPGKRKNFISTCVYISQYIGGFGCKNKSKLLPEN